MRRLLLTCLVALVAGPAMVAFASPVRASGNNCLWPDGRIFIESVAYGEHHYTSTELAWSGSSYARLRARSDTIGAWEWYRLQCVDAWNGLYAIRSEANGLYVSAEVGWTGDDRGLLRARTRSTAIGSWERFQLISASYWWTGYDTISIRATANGAFVSAERGWTGDRYGLLRAHAGSIGDWERFNFYY
jgi:hypothetical protein